MAAFDPDARPISPSSKGKNSNVTTKNEIDRHREELSQILKLKGLTVGHECFIDVNCILGEIEINSAAPYHLFLTPSFEIFAIDSNGSVLPVEMEVWGKLIYFIAAYEGKVSFTDSNWGNPLKGLVKPLLKQYNFYDKLNHKLRSVAITNLKELQENWEKAFKEMKEGEKISNANDALQKVLGQEWAYDFKLFALEKGSEEAKIVNPTTILLEKDFAKWWDKWETLKRQLPKKDSDLEKAVEFADSWLPLKLYGTLYHEVVAKDLHALEEALKQELDDVTIMEEYAKFHEDQKKEHGESNYLDYQLRVFAQSLMLKGYSQAFICGIFRNSDSKLTLE
ncbi:MAG: hypothetical protein LIO90_07025 [Bacteroidales bacterium]|nr:hypothetical protein [Bacteroidales bacterium]